MTEPHPLDPFLHRVVGLAALSTSGLCTIPAEGLLQLPNTAPTRCTKLALIHRLLEKKNKALAMGHPDAPPHHKVFGDPTDLGMTFVLPEGLGNLEVCDFFDMESGKRLFAAGLSHMMPSSDATAHQKLACATWVDRFFTDPRL
jgi:hypothetical protein